jgi:hypothetical protein
VLYSECIKCLISLRLFADSHNIFRWKDYLDFTMIGGKKCMQLSHCFPQPSLLNVELDI